MFKIDPPQKADGGRIGFGSGGITGAGFAGNQVEQSQPQPDNQPMEMPPNLGFQPIFPMPQRNIPGSGGIKELKQFLQAMGAPELGMGYNFPVGDRGILGVGIAPSGNVGMQFRKQFKDGSKPTSPGRRNFIKMMAGLASLPVVGKLFKPAAKIAEAGPVIKEGAKLGFDNFMLLVDKIKRLGKDISGKSATQERQKVTRYEGKDGSEYELVEDLTTGDISVTKDKPGGMTVGDESIDVIEDRSTFTIRKGEVGIKDEGLETQKSFKEPDEYVEGKTVFDQDGTPADIDDVDDKIINDIMDELKDVAPVNKKAGGGLAYMLGE